MQSILRSLRIVEKGLRFMVCEQLVPQSFYLRYVMHGVCFALFIFLLFVMTIRTRPPRLLPAVGFPELRQ